MNVSPNIQQRLFDALTVILLSRSSREALEGVDPKAFEQALAAANSADPTFLPLLAETRLDEQGSDEQARLAMGGYYVEVDGEPWCQVSREIAVRVGDVRRVDGLHDLYLICRHDKRAEVDAHADLVRRVVPEATVFVRPGGCPVGG